jgi:hypothetical protein
VRTRSILPAFLRGTRNARASTPYRRVVVGVATTVAAVMAMVVPGAAAQATGPAPTRLQVHVLPTKSTGMQAADFSNAEVDVFYDEANPPDSYSAPLMGTGTTDAYGNVTITLNTSMVTDPADLGDGNNNAFNATVAVIWSTGTGTGAEQDMILTEGSTTPITMTPDSSETVTSNTSRQASNIKRHVGTASNHVPVLALNSASGMNTDFTMTHNTSADRQTSVQVAWSYDGTAPFKVGAFFEEQKARTYSTTFSKSQSYHKFIWANYNSWKWYTQACGIRGCLRAKYKWELHDWTGDLTADNPDAACNGCAKIGVEDYNVPPYTTVYDDTVLLSPSGQKSATRGTSIIHHYGESLDFAGFVQLSAKATYGNITSVTWHAASSGCSSPQSRLLWGNGYTVPNAPIVQANCFVRPSP